MQVDTSSRTPRQPSAAPSYDFRYGETDLLENTISNKSRGFLIMTVVGIFGLMVAGLGYLVGVNTGTPNTNDTLLLIATSTERPTLSVATVTLGPPTGTATNTPEPTGTATETPTQAPCIQRIVEGGSLIGAIAACGYNNRDVMPTVMALNNIQDANAVSVGQEIIIPWPTSTIDPNALPTETATPAESSSSDSSMELVQIDLSIDPFAPTATPTLPPGVMWHRVQSGENVITIAVAFDANAKVLSELNPEIDFARCEFGERFGGPECLVQLSEGQMMRVPAPTATPTLSPTPDPNATATPTPTATFNVPSVVGPPDRSFFGRDELITLRWIPSASLQQGEAYRVDVEDITTGQLYSAITTEIYFLILPDWQGAQATRHEYTWTVGIIDMNQPDNVRQKTPQQRFIWQGQAESDAP